MSVTSKSDHLAAFVEKMRTENLPDIVIDTFTGYYHQVVAGESGIISETEIRPVEEGEVPPWDDLASYAAEGAACMAQSVRIILNGGLGTSMGLTGPKSLLPVKAGRSFLRLLVDQAGARRGALALMNSFSTHAQTVAALEEMAPDIQPRLFLQHRFPKILRADLSPARWPRDPDLEWNPPGHGDIYTAMATSGILDQLLSEGIRYAFISNSDNLGASLDPRLLGYFARHGLPFMMEVSQRTVADIKGGHLARHRDGYLLLRESAQCPEDELDAFRDVSRYRYFNTNNLWVDLPYLKELIDARGTVRLPMILNPKHLDPRDPQSPPVFQVESAMGSAISLFEGAGAVEVPRDRFFPVKKCSDLLVVRSDYVQLAESGTLTFNPHRAAGSLKVELDAGYYGQIDRFEARFAEGVPSMVACTALAIEGDVRFEKDVRLEGDVRIVHSGEGQAVVPAGSRLSGTVRL